MTGRQIIKNAAQTVAATAALAAAGYAALVVSNRARYGKVKGFADGAKDSLLDDFIPDAEVAEHHQIEINAPADVVMAPGVEVIRMAMLGPLRRAAEHRVTRTAA